MLWTDFLQSRAASILTHGAAVLMAVGYFGLLLTTPFWLAFLPAVLLAHRIGIMLHEYIHGIPFSRYRDCLATLSFFDGLLLMFGLLELFRGTHLSHHRWLNREGDSAFESAARRSTAGKRVLQALTNLEAVQHLKFYWEALHGKHPFVQRKRLVIGFMLSILWIAFWIRVGRPDLVWKLMVVTAFTASVPVSLRGAIEHHSHVGDSGFANEYRVVIPLFNLNRHLHHHEEPRRPWYLLRYRTAEPLSEVHYFTHWFRVHVKKEMALMQPMPPRKNVAPRS